MSESPKLNDLLAALADRGLGEAEWERLDALLAADPEARRAYIEHLSLHADLAEAPAPAASVEQVDEPALPMCIVEKAAPPSLPGIVIAIGIAAALLVACGLAVYVFTLTSESPNPAPPQPSTQPVATLIEAAGSQVIYEDGLAYEGGEYASGTYSIDSGRAQLLLRSRVTVNLHGETRMRMYNPRNVYVQRGEADFRVPSGVDGFTVHLPDRSQIIDLGTAFRVAVDDDGQTQLRVTEGAVAWTTGGELGESVLVNVGQTAEFIDGQLVIADRVEVFAENFDGFTAPTANFNGGQYETDLAVAFGGTLPGWSIEGFNEPHAVDRENRYGSEATDRNFALMLIHSTLETTLAGANASGASYELSLLASPAVYQDPDQATGEDDGLILEIVRSDGAVLASHTHHPGAWTGETALQPVRFEYTGDGSGELRLRIRPVNPNVARFAGAIDDLTVHAIAEPSETTSDENETERDEESRSTPVSNQGDTP